MKLSCTTLLLAMLCTVCSASAQTMMDPPSLFGGRFDALTVRMFTDAGDTNHTIHLSGRDSAIGYGNRFMLGNQWSQAPLGIGNRLRLNFENDKLDYPDIRNPKFDAIGDGDTTYLCWSPLYWLAGAEAKSTAHPGPKNCYAMQWVPSSPQTDGWLSWAPRAGDTTGSMFGFGFRDTVAGSVRSSGDSQFDRYVLLKAAHDSAGGGVRLVLDKARSQRELGDNYYHQGSDAVTTLWNGRHWYLAVNLQRLDALDNVSDTAVVLTVKLPTVTYKNPADSMRRYSYIRFDSVSVVRSGGVYDTLRTGRGLMDRALADSANAPDFDRQTFIIRRNMLPAWKADGSHDITISAFFTTIGGDPEYFNPLLRIGGYPNIDSMGLEVRYHGGCSVAIKWLRIETPQARKLFRGVLDTSLAARISYILDTLDARRAKSKWRKVKLAAFYFHDEPADAQLQAMRYVGKLLGGGAVQGTKKDSP